MSSQVQPRECVRVELVARVRARRVELEETIFERVRDGAHSDAGGDEVEYLAGLRAAVGAAVEHALASIELGEEGLGPTPPEAVSQAHRAARAGVSLDTVLRRYVLGSTVLGDFLMQEADRSSCAGRPGVLRNILSTQAAVLDRLMAAITNEYVRELERVGRSPQQRRAERVQRLLVGGCDRAADLGYELDEWHLGLVATGGAAGETLRGLAAALGRGLLHVPRGEETAWAWLGGPHELSVADIEPLIVDAGRGGVSLAVGEPGWGIEGWRLTHRQAQAALRVALQCSRPLTRYSDVALLSSMLLDDALAGSLIDIYLSPLGSNSDGGAVLRRTLSAYFAAERNASSAASALGVTRRTVENRMRAIEEKLGRRLRTHQAELEVALRLEALDTRLAGRV